MPGPLDRENPEATRDSPRQSRAAQAPFCAAEGLAEWKGHQGAMAPGRALRAVVSAARALFPGQLTGFPGQLAGVSSHGSRSRGPRAQRPTCLGTPSALRGALDPLRQDRRPRPSTEASMGARPGACRARHRSHGAPCDVGRAGLALVLVPRRPGRGRRGRCRSAGSCASASPSRDSTRCRRRRDPRRGAATRRALPWRCGRRAVRSRPE